MGNWKDELKKFADRLGSGKKRSAKSLGVKSDAALPPDEAPEDAWKEGVTRREKQSNRLSAQDLKWQKKTASPSGKRTKKTLPSGLETRKVVEPPSGHPAEKPAHTTPDSAKNAKKPRFVLKKGDLEDAPQCALSTQHEFRYPADWVEAGIGLQPPDSSGGRLMPIRIGLDFGTAYTKAAIKLADSAFVVDFNGVTAADNSRLLAGELSEDPLGQAWLGRSSSAERVFSRLKLPFISTSTTSLEDQAAAAVFLGWVIRYIRAWIYHHHPKLVADRKIAWELNIGIPSSSWADDGLVRRYRKVASAAWVLSQESAVPSISRSSELLLAGVPELGDIGLDDLQFVPEFVAQLAGYVMSPQRPTQGNELHLLVDAGAGTLDIACFGVWRPPREELYRFETWAATVVPLGTHFLMYARADIPDVEIGEWSDGKTVPSATEFAQQHDISKSTVEQVDDGFLREVSKEVGAVLVRTKKSRNPRASEWSSGLRTFLAGGGSSVPIYETAVGRALSRIRSKQKNVEFTLFDVVNRDDIPDSIKHRLSVAHGLTFDASSIGDTIPISEIEDVEEEARKRKLYDRDELYPK